MSRGHPHRYNRVWSNRIEGSGDGRIPDAPIYSVTSVAATEELEAARPAAAGARGWLVIVLLLLINIVNFIDRQLPFILISGIKADLKLTDSQIGLMAGVSFATVYSFGGLFLAHAADRWSPRWVLTISLAVWSAVTAASGLATSFLHLVIARAGVAVSEAGCTPSAHALISRLITPERRGLALTIFSLGVPIGSTLGLALGGWINDVASWRTAFFLVGLPGLLIALIAMFALPRMPKETVSHVAPARFFSSVRELFAQPAFRHMAIACSAYACGSYAINVFAPAFLMRVHGLSASQAGLYMGAVFGVGGMAGTFFGGVIAERLARRNPAWRQYLPAFGQWLSLPFTAAAWLAPDLNISVACMAIAYMLTLSYLVPTFTALQSVVSDRMRATASAMLLFCLTIVGASVGPMAVGWISDQLIPTFGDLSLRYAMCAMILTTVVSGAFFIFSGRALSAVHRRQG